MTRLFGVILDVDIRLTENAFYEKRVHTMNWRQYPRYFLNNIKSNRQIGLHFAWPTVDTKNLFDEILVADFHAMNNTDKRRSKVDKILYEEKFIPLNRFVFGVSRRSQWGKKLRWQLQKMRPEVLFLEHRAPTDTDLLQEYYFPVEKCKCFITLTLLSASNRQMQEFVVFFSYR
jgi:decaprenylphospho-beta-D-ribofuranose 2-oxidase